MSNWTIDVKYSEGTKSYEAFVTLENDGVKTEYQVIRKDSKKGEIEGFDKEKYSFGFCSTYAKTPEEALKMAKEFIDKKHKEMLELEELKSKNITIKYDPESDTFSDYKLGDKEGRESKIDAAIERIGNCIITHNINRVDFLSTSGLNTAELAIKSILKDIYGDE